MHTESRRGEWAKMDAESGSAVEVFRSVSVPLSRARAFELFTTRMTEFWPKEHSIGNSELAEVVVEPRNGGRLVRTRRRRQRMSMGPGGFVGAATKGGVALADRCGLGSSTRV